MHTITYKCPAHIAFNFHIQLKGICCENGQIQQGGRPSVKGRFLTANGQHARHWILQLTFATGSSSLGRYTYFQQKWVWHHHLNTLLC